MNTIKFNEINEDLRKHSVDLLLKKGEEYANNNNRLANFKNAASIWGLINPRIIFDKPATIACFGMMLKHIVSIIDIINSEESVSIDFAKEKFGDTINYFHLLFSNLIEEGGININEEES